jgi:hypothetical protein
MTQLTIILSFVAFLTASDYNVNDIIQLIRSGKTTEASESLDLVLDKIPTDGNLMFCSALLEPDADSSTQIFRNVLTSNADDSFKQEACFRLAQYAFIRGDFSTTFSALKEYQLQWPGGIFESEVIRLEICSIEQSGESERALGMVDKYLKTFTHDNPMQLGLVDKARLFLATGKKTGASRILQRLTQESEGVGIPQALYLSAISSYQRRDFDEASRQYSLLFEEYPLAIGLGTIEDQITTIPGEVTPDSPSISISREVAPVVYVVKVGVFSVFENAQALIDQFKNKNIFAEAVSRDRDNKTYYIVYAGKFSKRQQAEQFKDSLQTVNGEKYEVIMR